MNLGLLAALLALGLPVSSFTLQSSSLKRTASLAPTCFRRRTVCFSSFDYEYLPPNPDANPGGETTATTLPSSYPPGTPAALRGEAIRSALLSGRCIGWEFSKSSMSTGGVLKVQGKGMKDFLNNKLTQDFSSSSTTFQEACLLDAKGRVIDRLRVSILDSETALILTSPGHSSQHLLERFDPFIFPLDQIELTNYNDNDQSFIFTLASPQWKDVQKVLTEQALPKNKSFPFPSRSNQCVQWKLDNDVNVLVIPSTCLPSVACVGYTLVFYGSDDDTAKSAGSQMWQHLISDANPDGPIEAGALEYETLRVEAGQPAYEKEIGLNKKLKTSPLELHWQDETINMDKGCYLGQEGIASIAKNPRGPPRTLYQVVFEDDFNIYETQSQGEKTGNETDNLTKPPRSGEKLFALGSNNQLSVGTLTSVAEAGGTGVMTTVALALVRRADSIMKQMKELDLEIPRDPDDFIIDIGTSSGMIKPPPLDPLDGLEIIVEGTFTVGTLKGIPSRRLRKGSNMFDDRIVVEGYFEDGTMPPAENTKVVDPLSPADSDDDESDDLERIQAEVEQAAAEAEAAAAVAERKAEKMELLRKRAEEAMARRKKKSQEKKEE